MVKLDCAAYSFALMIVLAFDTCFDACSVCVAWHGNGGMTELANVGEHFATGHAEKLIPFVDDSMRRAGVAFSHCASLENPSLRQG